MGIKEWIRKNFLSLFKLIRNVKGFFNKVRSILSYKSPTNDRESDVCAAAERPKHVVVTIPELGYSLDCTSANDEDNEYFVDYSVEEFTTVDAEEVDDIEAIKNAMLEISSTANNTHHHHHHHHHRQDVIIIKEERWIKHYSNRQLLLLVGEGDFSFSSCLAVAFGFAPYLIATSLDSEDFLKNNYGKAMLNIAELRSRGSIVMHEIDATKMADHAFLGHFTFDRIVYNFPFAGFFKNMPRESQLSLHRGLISLFLKNAKEMISEDGEIHVTHKTNAFHREWNIVSIASSHGLKMIEEVRFNHFDYPRYRTKCGFGGDNNFNCNPSKTYKFGLV